MTPKTFCRAVGLVLLVTGLAMIPPALIGLLCGDGTGEAFAWVALPSALVGGVMWAWGRRQPVPPLPSIFAVLLLSAVAVIAVSTVPYILHGFEPMDAVFESTSGWTTTGATAFRAEELPDSILIWRALTQWLGGLGILIAAIVLLPYVQTERVQLLSAQDLAEGGKFKPKIPGTGLDLLKIYLALTALNALLLLMGGLSFRDSTCMALSTISTGGFSTRTAALPAGSGLYVEIVTILFMLAGATNFLMHVRLLRGNLKVHVRSEFFRSYLVVTGAVLLMVMIVTGLNGWPQGFGMTFRRALFDTISFTTTTGFRGGDPLFWSAHVRTIFLLAIFVGGMAGSTAGGIKVQRWLLVVRASWLEVLRLLYPSRIFSPRFERRAADPLSIERSLLLITLWILLFVAGIFVLLAFLPPTDDALETALTTSGAAINNVGAAFGATAGHWGGLDGLAKLAMALLMLLGRLEFFALIAATAPYVWRAPSKVD